MKPMLAKKMTPGNVRFPCFVQPKIDGYRCLFDGVVARSRSGRPFLPHVQQLLTGMAVPEGCVRDGELALPPEYPFEDLQSAVAGGGPLARKLAMETFDVITPEPMPFADRRTLVPDLVETYYVTSETQMENRLDAFLAAGYEGLIARNPKAPYVRGRTDALLKYKRFEDAEFPVVGVTEAGGKDAGTAILHCRTEGGRIFAVKPEGSREHRQRLWRRRSCYLGRRYTVMFQGRTRAGVPRFATGKGFAA